MYAGEGGSLTNSGEPDSLQHWKYYSTNAITECPATVESLFVNNIQVRRNQGGKGYTIASYELTCNAIFL